jgi:hypothetical protein
MKSPYFRRNLDLGRCGLGHVLMIDWMHKLAGLARTPPPASSPATREVLATLIAHNSFALLAALSWMRRRANTFYRMLGANFGRQ